jgi:phenylpyruvate tautomerase PptA (4-oxalocrotonate tautomerase family)
MLILHVTRETREVKMKQQFIAEITDSTNIMNRKSRKIVRFNGLL